MQGVLAFGDSITNGGGELQWGVALQSWAHWLARAYGLPYSGYATDGALARDVVDDQIRAFEARQAGGGRFDIGCLYIGVNDVRGVGFEEGAFERDHRTALEFLAGRCERVLTCTIPLDLGRPRAGHVLEGNAAIERSAAAAGAVVCDLRDFGARNRVMTDHVHPTALGQVEIAERAARALGREPQVWPSRLVSYETTWWKRLRGDATYVYRHAKVSARSAGIHAMARTRGVRSAHATSLEMWHVRT
jgi:lysophospholipase L1-like esterase